MFTQERATKRERFPEDEPIEVAEHLRTPELENAISEWRALMKKQRERSRTPEGQLEPKAGVPKLQRLIRMGAKEETKDRYESFSIRKEEFTDDNELWICWPGLSSAEEGDNTFFSGFNIPGAMDAVPHRGTVYMFHGPAALAGFSPEQCMKVHDEVAAAADLIVEEHLKNHPGAKVRVFGFSGGTSPATYWANQYGLKHKRPVDKCILVSPGESIAYGIFKTYAMAELARDLFSKGITPDMYHHAIARYTQMHNTTALPAGRNMVIHGAEQDGFIEMYEKFGTNDFVQRLIESGKQPVFVKHEKRNHASIILSLLLQENLGMDPYRLREPRSVWSNVRAFEDPKLMGEVDKLLSTYDENDLRAIGFLLSQRGKGRGKKAWNWSENLSPYEKGIAYGLKNRGICTFETTYSDTAGPHNTFVLTGTDDIDAKLRARTYIPGTLATMVRKLRDLEKNPEFAAHYELAPMTVVDVFDEIKKFGLPSGEYVVNVAGTFDMRSGEDFLLSITPQLYARLKENGWEEYTEKYSNGESELLLKNGRVRAHTKDFEEVRRISTSFEGIRVIDWRKVKTNYELGSSNPKLKAA